MLTAPRQLDPLFSILTHTYSLLQSWPRQLDPFLQDTYLSTIPRLVD